MLATRIAESMSLPETRSANIAQAALLHDVGKTESDFAEILKKPQDLSPEERKVIESHVETGVRLLRSLSSLPEEVIQAVHAHHEREDGRGYPRQLMGDAIPLGAKIISVCDAVDAMLSDRPYRKGLPLATVRDELTRGCGTQFDPVVVGHVIQGGMLEEHLVEVRREYPPPPGGVSVQTLGEHRELDSRVSETQPAS